MQELSIVANNIKAAALRRAFWPERPHQHMTTGLNGVGHLSNVSHAVVHLRKKMEDCTVVPNLVSIGQQLSFDNIGNEPIDLFRGWS
jgi:hypothetical protein